ncbi:erythromycin esterase family protein [Candidatus Saccharibacteria bacterium]|nr:erythromycin esterase family protein [Candidatus Saccharibacteria bacterium]
MDIGQIGKEVSSAQLVGIGESTHGTHEFFDFKAKLFIELLQRHGFNTLLFEDSARTCQPINEYIKTGRGNLGNLMSGLYSVWRVEELKNLILWLHDNRLTHRVEFVGFDIDQSLENIEQRDELMAKNILTYVKSKLHTKAFIWAHNSHVKYSDTDKNDRPMGLFLRRLFGRDYLSIAQFFGCGEFSATQIDESKPNSPDRTLKTVAFDNIPDNLLEAQLDTLDDKPYFLSKTGLAIKGFKSDKAYAVRSIGWGIVPSRANEYIENCNVAKEFGGLTYFPVAKHSQPLSQ